MNYFMIKININEIYLIYIIRLAICNCILKYVSKLKMVKRNN